MARFFSLILLGNLFIWAFAGKALAQLPFSDYKRLTPDNRIIQLWVDTQPFLKNQDTEKVTLWLHQAQTEARHLSDDRLYWMTSFLQIQYKALQQARAKKSVTAYADAEAFMETCPVEVVRGCYYIFYGQHLFRTKLNFDKSLLLLFRAKNIFEKIGYENIPEAILYLFQFGDDYYWFQDYRKAIHYMELAARFRCEKLFAQHYCQNTMGMAYLNLKEYDQALKCFRNVISLANAQHNTNWMGIGNNGYGKVLLLQKKYREALPYLYTDVALNSRNVPESAALSCLLISQSLLALDSTDKAKTFIDKAQRLFNGYVFSAYRLNYFETQTAYFRKTGNQIKTIQYLDSTAVLKDSLNTVFNNRAISFAESQANAERYLGDLKRVETEKQNAIQLRNTIIGSLTLLALLGLYALNQKRQNLQREKQIEEERRKLADEQLANAEAQLEQYLNNLKEKNALITLFTEELNAKKLTTVDQELRQQQLTTLVNSVLLTDKDWLRFRQLFEQVHPNFFDMLRSSWPELTPAEIRLLALLKLSIPTKEIAFMLGVSPESVRKSRYRLRKKLEASPNQADIQLLISQL